MNSSSSFSSSWGKRPRNGSGSSLVNALIVIKIQMYSKLSALILNHSVNMPPNKMEVANDMFVTDAKTANSVASMPSGQSFPDMTINGIDLKVKFMMLEKVSPPNANTAADIYKY